MPGPWDTTRAKQSPCTWGAYFLTMVSIKNKKRKLYSMLDCEKWHVGLWKVMWGKGGWELWGRWSGKVTFAQSLDGGEGMCPGAVWGGLEREGWWGGEGGDSQQREQSVWRSPGESTSNPFESGWHNWGKTPKEEKAVIPWFQRETRKGNF